MHLTANKAVGGGVGVTSHSWIGFRPVAAQVNSFPEQRPGGRVA